ncbi:MAG: hypothetical protein GQ477_04105 [Nanohaloarchaea archaeon]|nr:hypothetical protein [Candidatus Nanohaloarchaea archaeon]
MTILTKILISEQVSTDLALRNSADRFFDLIDSIKQDTLIIDFKNVDFISRSFAHQYYLRKKSSKKTIDEINISSNINKMFKIVSEPRPKKQVITMVASDAISI